MKLQTKYNLHMTLPVGIDVPDLKKVETFYIQALGCKKLRDQGKNMSVLSTENCDIYLQEKENGSKPVPINDVLREYKRHWTPVHIDFLAENVEELVQKVIERDGSHEGGESGEWGSIAHCADPFGNGFCIINE